MQQLVAQIEYRPKYQLRHTTVALVFGKGQSSNKMVDGWATAYDSAGEVWWQAGCELENINVSRISMESLQRISKIAIEQIS